MASKQAKIIHAKRIATPKEATTMIGDFVPEKEPSFRGAAIIYDQDTGELVAAHLPVQNTRQLRQELVGEKFDKISRASAFSSDSKTFGYAPRRHIIGREGCAPSRSRRDNPHLDSLLGGLADECADSMTDFAPNIVEKDRETLRQIKPEWRLGERKLWSSGVINKTAQLPYHRDTFNFPAWSAMPVLRRGVREGYLHIPEYDLVLPCQDSHACYFKGQEIVHGVTPMQRKNDDSYRFSIVFYALRGMKDCFTHAEETAYAQRRRSERERDMAKRLAAGDTSIPAATKRK